MFRSGILREHSVVFSLVMRTGDVLMVLFAALLTYFWRFDSWEMSMNYQMATLIALLLVPLAFSSAGIYQSWRGGLLISEMRRVTLALIGVILILILLGFVTKTSSDYSRLWLGGWALLSWMLLMAYHVFLRFALRWIRQKGFNTRSIAVIGAGELGREVVRRINEASWTGLKVVGLYDDNSRLHHHVLDGVRVRGDINSLLKLMTRRKIDEVWVALPLRAEARVKEILFELRHHTVTVRFVPDIFGFRLLRHSVSSVAGIPVMNLNSTPMVGVNRVIKGVSDRLLSLVILILISPVMFVIAIAVKLSSSGPVLFRQRRHGWDGKPIKVYKFRTMAVHQENKGTVTQASRNDPRITSIGAFLRRTSLDELPQFFNVLQGRMSIVGPRPHAMEHTEQYKDMVDAYMQRHKVKPGITGWAQINGWRGETDTLDKMKKRVEYDLYYIENWSIWFDLKIIALTILRGFTDKSAY